MPLVPDEPKPDAEPTGNLETALKHARRLLQTDPVLAAEQAAEILKAIPGHPMAVLLLGSAQRLCGDGEAAIGTLRELVARQKDWAPAHHELGLALADAGDTAAARISLRVAVSLNPNLPDAWRLIGDLSSLAGDAAAADNAYLQHIRASTHDPRLLAAGAALLDGKLPEAEHRLKAHLMAYPTDVAAIRMLAEVAARLGRNRDAASLLGRCLELAPNFAAARNQFAIVLQRLNRYRQALEQLALLIGSEPRNSTYHNNRAVILGKIGEYAQAINLYEQILAANPQHPGIWMTFGHVLAAANRQEDAIAAYRKSIKLEPDMGEAYWSLANLKTFRFSAAEIVAMQASLRRDDLDDPQCCSFEFALGKSFEDECNFEESMRWYVRANARRRPCEGYHAKETVAFVSRSKALFTHEFFASRKGWGAAARDPIFVVGMPRAGSTLIEQILASHPAVEGTMELPNIITMAGELASAADARGAERPYPGVLANLDSAALRRLGEEYIQETRIQRKTQRPFFIDKMPTNFLHLGLICLILPNAKIIDARRHPMACCFSAFKMQFADGHRYSYDQGELGGFYRQYVAYMQHFDAVLPGRVHRIHYERMVGDTEHEIRRLLDYCGLPFEPQCLLFHENRRPVRTASAQQVRQPIYREGLAHWTNYSPWLGPLEQALGDVLETSPQESRSPP
jgi:tetratricopeptide (TPR) repeat protein